MGLRALIDELSSRAKNKLERATPALLDGGRAALRGFGDAASLGAIKYPQAALLAATSDQTYDEALNEVNRQRAQEQLDNPTAYTVGQVGGSVAPALIPGIGAGGLVANTARQAGLGAIGGALSRDNLSEATLEDMAYGAGAGGALGAVGHGVGAAAKGLSRLAAPLGGSMKGADIAAKEEAKKVLISDLVGNKKLWDVIQKTTGPQKAANVLRGGADIGAAKQVAQTEAFFKMLKDPKVRAALPKDALKQVEAAKRSYSSLNSHITRIANAGDDYRPGAAGVKKALAEDFSNVILPAAGGAILGGAAGATGVGGLDFGSGASLGAALFGLGPTVVGRTKLNAGRLALSNVPRASKAVTRAGTPLAAPALARDMNPQNDELLDLFNSSGEGEQDELLDLFNSR